MRAMLRRLTRAACISVHAPDGSHSYVAIFFILVLPNTSGRPIDAITSHSSKAGSLGAGGSVGPTYQFDYAKLRQKLEETGPIWRGYHLNSTPNPPTTEMTWRVDDRCRNIRKTSKRKENMSGSQNQVTWFSLRIL